MPASPSAPPPGIEVLAAVLDRRSTAALVEPGPDADEVELLLQAAATVPDHGRLRPWRFVVIDGDARERFADALEDGGRARDPDLSDGVRAKLRSKAFVAPTLVAVIACPRPAKVERWEQVASAACCGYAIVLAAHAMGLGAMWKSVPFRTGPLLAEMFDMEADDELLGWVLVGTPADPSATVGRGPADLGDRAHHLDPGGRLLPHRPVGSPP
ncbi:MAG TPA: nitroreductase [Acidimicrobiales bacterium]|nr:nitroreductase [Acidimicrobiales bacterium]